MRLEKAAFGEVHRAEQFVVPKHVAARRVLFGHEQFHESERFRGLRVETDRDRDAGAFFKITQHFLRVDRIVRAIHDQRRGTAMRKRPPREEKRGEGGGGDKEAHDFES